MWQTPQQAALPYNGGIPHRPRIPIGQMTMPSPTQAQTIPVQGLLPFVWEPPPPSSSPEHWLQWYRRLSLIIAQRGGDPVMRAAAIANPVATSDTFVAQARAFLTSQPDASSQAHFIAGVNEKLQASFADIVRTMSSPAGRMGAIRGANAIPQSAASPANIVLHQRASAPLGTSSNVVKSLASSSTIVSPPSAGQVTSPASTSSPLRSFDAWKERIISKQFARHHGPRLRAAKMKLEVWLRPKIARWFETGDILRLDWSNVPLPEASLIESVDLARPSLQANDWVGVAKLRPGEIPSPAPPPRPVARTDPPTHRAISGTQAQRDLERVSSASRSRSSSRSQPRSSSPSRRRSTRSSTKKRTRDLSPVSDDSGGGKGGRTEDLTIKKRQRKGDPADDSNRARKRALAEAKQRAKALTNSTVAAGALNGLTREELMKRSQRAARFSVSSGATPLHTDAVLPSADQKSTLLRLGEAVLRKKGVVWNDTNRLHVMTAIMKCRGRSQKLERSYLRTTGGEAPDPNVFRPEEVLRQCLPHVLKKFGDDWEKLNDQLRGIRQDLQVQGIVSEFNIEVYQTHALLSLQNGNLGQFNQCQTQLTYLYKNKKLKQLNSRPTEFYCYGLLYEALMGHALPFCRLYNCCPSKLRRVSTTRFAVEISRSIKENNYVAYFRLEKQAPFQSGKMLTIFRPQRRIKALSVIAAASKSVPIRVIADWLNFSSQAECANFIKGEKGIIAKEGNEDVLMCKESIVPFKESPLQLFKSQIRAALG